MPHPSTSTGRVSEKNDYKGNNKNKPGTKENLEVSYSQEVYGEIYMTEIGNRSRMSDNTPTMTFPLMKRSVTM